GGVFVAAAFVVAGGSAVAGSQKTCCKVRKPYPKFCQNRQGFGFFFGKTGQNPCAKPPKFAGFVG
ncbi:MAG: hypothetical protein J6J51_07095, partial [Clostridia bacterium]|nr:hypothetical protein [Clostridia bacterium]